MKRFLTSFLYIMSSFLYIMSSASVCWAVGPLPLQTRQNLGKTESARYLVQGIFTGYHNSAERGLMAWSEWGTIASKTKIAKVQNRLWLNSEEGQGIDRILWSTLDLRTQYNERRPAVLSKLVNSPNIELLSQVNYKNQDVQSDRNFNALFNAMYTNGFVGGEGIAIRVISNKPIGTLFELPGGGQIAVTHSVESYKFRAPMIQLLEEKRAGYSRRGRISPTSATLTTFRPAAF